MNVNLLTEQHLVFLRLKGGCTDLSESTNVNMPHGWKSHFSAHISFKTQDTPAYLYKADQDSVCLSI